MTKKIHAHEVLKMMEGNSYSTESLYNAIVERFGVESRFHTCSVEDLDAAQIIKFLESKGKFKPTESGFTMDMSKVCKEY